LRVGANNGSRSVANSLRSACGSAYNLYITCSAQNSPIPKKATPSGSKYRVPAAPTYWAPEIPQRGKHSSDPVQQM
jgi:hypothetical protein